MLSRVAADFLNILPGAKFNQLLSRHFKVDGFDVRNSDYQDGYIYKKG